ncbi:short chain dehydrogenase [Myxococcus stipitatus DSM 14675]|uniref:Short chain dehydrogenase n=1 Tax=Myxococcus stipitatus (strain DSM 14675 / JCM 12634 / Mx s8) TaxID=1278073 RepID=L7UIR0_MYXSD|nr:SDR family oxidoreductase [Myxococcus stipitatus]AGC47785.1 short chain dehydrogenase [Myxococcus stipitatus DSM 14675]
MRKNILITGASSGLGEGMAREFAARGHHLALCARRTDRLEALRSELLAKHPGLHISVRELDVNEHERVFEVFNAFAEDLGSLDRIIINAGIGVGKRLGTGNFATNVKTAQTNFVAAVAQCEAAVGILRKQGQGHLVTISSMSAMRGLPRHLTVYAATKAGLATLTEGIRAELLGTPIKVSTIYPGYIHTELNAGAKKLPFAVDAEKGSRALVKAIEREPVSAYVPGWPWTVVGFFLRNLPLELVAKMS